ncbi:hypothetical protein LNKW23_09490 [Paralimibaculum aggregatum]|uniref:Alpha/beta hydrolase n=1 Tax=Paralimibaculum aggregatum TaxID=3036245 RepID=A0ABQ6LEH6_9RHOB|nr:hypothetical protein [Limibaculum sp. NKW23]GMG81736.1 hypothetical protein LNKW23_09490 [Limibaculum sp. NKW23]
MSALPPTSLVCFPTEGRGLVAGDYWRGGDHALLLVGEGSSPWAAQIGELVAGGLTVLEPSLSALPAKAPEEALERLARIIAGGVAYLRTDGAKAVSILGVGAGAAAAAEAVLAGLIGNVETLILLAPPKLSGPIGCISGRVIFVVADEDEATEHAVRQHTMAPDTTQLTVFTGDYAAAELFDSPHAGRLLKLIRDALPPIRG